MRVELCDPILPEALRTTQPFLAKFRNHFDNAACDLTLRRAEFRLCSPLIRQSNFEQASTGMKTKVFRQMILYFFSTKLSIMEYLKTCSCFLVMLCDLLYLPAFLLSRPYQVLEPHPNLPQNPEPCYSPLASYELFSYLSLSCSNISLLQPPFSAPNAASAASITKSPSAST